VQVGCDDSTLPAMPGGGIRESLPSGAAPTPCSKPRSRRPAAW
jgi:hypothetical protein